MQHRPQLRLQRVQPLEVGVDQLRGGHLALADRPRLAHRRRPHQRIHLSSLTVAADR
jgi:hypothetical protein